MRKTFFYLFLIILMALSLGILTGCVQKEQNEQTNTVNNNIEDSVNNELEVVEEEVKIEKLTQIEAKKVVKEKFDLAIRCYLFDLFDYDSSEYVNVPDVGTGFIIKNFDSVTKYFTENGKNDLINNLGLLFEYQGEYYLELGGIPEYFSDYELIDVDVEETRISATYKVDVSVGEEVIIDNKEIPFEIVLENGEWLIDKFIDASNVEE